MHRTLRRRLLAVSPLVVLAPWSALAALKADEPSGEPHFRDQLRGALDELQRSGHPAIRRLYVAAAASPATIAFRRMTDDPATWSNDGDPDRGHTEPDDGRPKREGRTEPTNATIFIPISAVEPGSARWKSGLLVHELVHALDLTSGRYNRDYTVRERRAVFIQNIWREHVGHPLRVSYHRRFATLDYQHASAHGQVTEYLQYIFSRPDFPAPPPAP